MRTTFRPLSPIDAERLAPRGGGSRYTFKAGWSATLELLERELRMLGAREVVIEAGFRDSEIRLDGMPRADARQPEHPGVVISFESDHGPLRYGTGEYPHWQANVRAVALGLEALRKVDRYGITRRGEQYTGFRALPAGDGPNPGRGSELIGKHGGVRAALKATHPDHGGDARDFADVQAARKAVRA